MDGWVSLIDLLSDPLTYASALVPGVLGIYYYSWALKPKNKEKFVANPMFLVLIIPSSLLILFAIFKINILG